MTTNIVFSGVGGQGIVVASDIFCEAALIDELDVAKAEVHGMAQRGGSIVAHVRVGEKIYAPLIEKGEANIIVGFEMLEREVKQSGNSGRVYLPKGWIGKRVKIIRISKTDKLK